MKMGIPVCDGKAFGAMPVRRAISNARMIGLLIVWLPPPYLSVVFY
jgi:hypothetical protein